MRNFLRSSVLFSLLLHMVSAEGEDWQTAKSIYEFSAKDIDGNMVSLEKYSNSQLKTWLDVQEPGTEEQIKTFAQSYKAEFDLFSKIDVNGPNAHPLWKWLKEQPNGKGTFGKLVVLGGYEAQTGRYREPSVLDCPAVEGLVGKLSVGDVTGLPELATIPHWMHKQKSPLFSLMFTNTSPVSSFPVSSLVALTSDGLSTNPPCGQDRPDDPGVQPPWKDALPQAFEGPVSHSQKPELFDAGITNRVSSARSCHCAKDTRYPGQRLASKMTRKEKHNRTAASSKRARYSVRR
ncbi:hypothetical protein JZ751_024530 [Albula glossodonta]|uniref:Uncharacterized protein n=1 Tax=Albula glossodonta TaxID=121402 RepID=A0A8T2PHL0_9TELE|nr:hypothetical protein JZ751_024530 [Albula glossodonta]